MVRELMNSRILRRKLAIACVLVALAILGHNVDVVAGPPCQLIHRFYSDAACTNQTGYRVINCSGSPALVGSIPSPGWRTVEVISSCGGECSDMGCAPMQ